LFVDEIRTFQIKIQFDVSRRTRTMQYVHSWSFVEVENEYSTTTVDGSSFFSLDDADQ